MGIEQYSDDDLLEEVKRRGFEIKLKKTGFVCDHITIGGIRFDL